MAISCHFKQQHEERDKSVDKKVNTFTVRVFGISCLFSGLKSLHKIYNKICYIVLFINGKFVLEINFPAIILKQFEFLQKFSLWDFIQIFLLFDSLVMT